ncbi:MAG TPA: hypothetical protein VM344_08305, partial [Vitreimonas sp.]|nr:hypothetical protein [Vitreimonas sp.]
PVTDPPVTEPPATDPPTTSPTPTPPSTPLAVASDVIVVGTTKFNAHGSRVAFSARPADGSHGPDIYVWTVGDEDATRITNDHHSVFSGWLGGLVLGSRAVPASEAEPVVEGASTAVVPEAFVIDPATGVEAVIDGGPIWQPAVDPTGRLAVYWEGTIKLDEAGVEWRPAEGRLVVAPWPGNPNLSSGTDDATESEERKLDPLPAPPLPTAFPQSVAPNDEIKVLFDGPIPAWQARWEADGTHLGLWIADEEDPTIGRLTLYAVNPVTGRLDADDPALPAQWARPGFEIGDDYLAWATRDGQDGKGSLIKVVAWTEDGLGQVETKPGEDVLVVQH